MAGGGGYLYRDELWIAFPEANPLKSSCLELGQVFHQLQDVLERLVVW